MANIALLFCKRINHFFVLELIIALKNDDKVAFEKTYYTYYEKLFNYYKRKTGSEFIAEELSQETFIKFWTYRKTLSEEHSLETQLFRIAKTLFIDALKKRKLEIIYMDEITHLDISNDAHNQMDSKEFAKQVDAHINNLPPIRQKVFKMSRLEGLSHNEIANLLSISPKSVNNHITKAIKQLRELIVAIILIMLSIIFL